MCGRDHCRLRGGGVRHPPAGNGRPLLPHGGGSNGNAAPADRRDVHDCQRHGWRVGRYPRRPAQSRLKPGQSFGFEMSHNRYGVMETSVTVVGKKTGAPLRDQPEISCRLSGRDGSAVWIAAGGHILGPFPAGTCFSRETPPPRTRKSSNSLPWMALGKERKFSPGFSFFLEKKPGLFISINPPYVF